jgi:hypothetical protein
MAESLRYLLASVGLGAVAYWGSEAMFWGFPPPGQDVAEIVGTGCANAFAAACALSLTILTGVRGLAALVLGGAVLGFVVEGVVVGTMYENFPWQIVWTPLAWHMPVTALAVFGLNRRLQGAAAWRHAGAFIGVGLLGRLMSGYWPGERPALPGTAAIWAYQAGAGVAAAAGFALLSALGRLPAPPKPVLWSAPGLAVLFWLAQTIAAPGLVRLAFPAMAGLTLWAMWRLAPQGPVGRVGLRLGLPVPLWRHLVFLIAPALVAAIAAHLVAGMPGFDSSALLALTLGPAGLGLWLWFLWRAWRSAVS